MRSRGVCDLSAPLIFDEIDMLPNIELAELSRRYKEDGMLAYTQLVQQKERELGVDILTHQKWYIQESIPLFLVD